ncbi:YfmQ family protein [Mesobacillus foraminis]|uniref:YfmQ family protein n=1 Tax=Mesobacillus foraminis TaxID=279826 RepID=UPI0039A0ECDC
MTWTVVIFIVGLILKFIMSPPSAVVAWVLSKFALHPILDPKEVAITFNGKHLEEDGKIRFTKYFNESIFLRKYYIFPGNEKLFLYPETDVTPFIINIKKGRKEVKLFVYSYDDHVDVVKQYKKKVESYSLRSDGIQNFRKSSNALSINVI